MNHNRVNFMKPPRSIYSPGAAVRPAHRRRQMWGARGGVYGRNNVRWELLQMPSGAGKDGMRPWCQGARHVFCSNCADHTRYLAGGQTGEPPCPRTLHQTRAKLYKVFCIGTAVVGALRGCAKEIGKTVCCEQNKLHIIVPPPGGNDCESRFLGIPNSPNLNVAVSLNINFVSDFSQIRADPISDRLQKPPAW